MMTTLVRYCVVAAGVCLCACASDPLAALAQAQSGETVVLPDGTYTGPLTVRAGVTLAAEHAGQAVVAAAGAGAALVVETDPALPPAVISGLRVSAAADVGILARGGGALRVQDVRIDCQRGFGLAAQDLAQLELEQLELAGRISAADLSTLAFPVKASQAPVVGLGLAGVKQAKLSRVTITGFGGFGAVLVDTAGSWDGGSVSANVGVGVLVDGGDLTVSNVAVSSTLAGELGTAILAYGVVVTGSGKLASKSLELSGNHGVGLLQDQARSEHEGLRVVDNGDVGIWVQQSAGSVDQPALRISGSATQVAGNKGGGLFAISSGGLVVRDASILQSQEKAIPVDELGLTKVADGIQLSKLTGGAELRDLTLSDNLRVGVLLSGPAPSGSDVTLSGLHITGTGKYGLITEDGQVVSSSWQLQRDPALEQADAGFSGRLAVAVAQSVPSVALIRNRGLIGDGGVLGPSGRAVAGAGVSQVGLIPEID